MEVQAARNGGILNVTLPDSLYTVVQTHNKRLPSF